MIRVNLKTLWQPSPIAAGRFSGAVSRITATAAGPTVAANSMQQAGASALPMTLVPSLGIDLIACAAISGSGETSHACQPSVPGPCGRLLLSDQW